MGRVARWGYPGRVFEESGQLVFQEMMQFPPLKLNQEIEIEIEFEFFVKLYQLRAVF